MNLSIVVPVYNVENYIDKCFESLLKNNAQEMEIIVVNDGSTDSSKDKCEKWASNDNRVKIFSKENGGLMSAWKYGVRKAQGEYIGFVDSDDWIDGDMFENMLSFAQNEKVDVVCVGSIMETGNGSIPVPTNFNGLYLFEDIKQKIFPCIFYNKNTHKSGLNPARWVKLVRREVLLQCLGECKENVSIGEDSVMTLSVFNKIKNVFFIKDFYPYHYRIHSTSMLKKYNHKNYEQLKNLKFALDEINSKVEHDFCEQINLHFINFVCYEFEKIIIDSKLKRKEKRRIIKTIYKDTFFKKTLKKTPIKYLSRRLRIYLFFIRLNMINFLIFLRKIRKV